MCEMSYTSERSMKMRLKILNNLPLISSMIRREAMINGNDEINAILIPRVHDI